MDRLKYAACEAPPFRSGFRRIGRTPAHTECRLLAPVGAPLGSEPATPPMTRHSRGKTHDRVSHRRVVSAADRQIQLGAVRDTEPQLPLDA